MIPDFYYYDSLIIVNYRAIDIFQKLARYSL